MDFKPRHPLVSERSGQHAERQLDGAKLNRTCADKTSGKDTKRAQLGALLIFIRCGDTVVARCRDSAVRIAAADLRCPVAQQVTDPRRRAEAAGRKAQIASDYGISRETLYPEQNRLAVDRANLGGSSVCCSR